MFGKQGYGLLKDLAEISEKSFHENRSIYYLTIFYEKKKIIQTEFN